MRLNRRGELIMERSLNLMFVSGNLSVNWRKIVWSFAIERKKLWLLALVGTLLVLSALMVIAQYSAVAPFLYTLF